MCTASTKAMTIAVFGASGRTAPQVVAQALRQGEETIALVRGSVDHLSILPNDALQVVVGNTAGSSSVDAVLAPSADVGSDAITHGVETRRTGETTLRDGKTGVMQATSRHDVISTVQFRELIVFTSRACSRHTTHTTGSTTLSSLVHFAHIISAVESSPPTPPHILQPHGEVPLS